MYSLKTSENQVFLSALSDIHNSGELVTEKVTIKISF